MASKVEAPSIVTPTSDTVVNFGGLLHIEWKFERPQSYQDRRISLMNETDSALIVFNSEVTNGTVDEGLILQWSMSDPKSAVSRRMFENRPSFDKYFILFQFTKRDEKGSSTTSLTSDYFTILNATDTIKAQSTRAPTTSSLPPTTTPSNTDVPSRGSIQQPRHPGLTTSAKVGIGVGAFAFSLLVGLLFLACFIGRRRRGLREFLDPDPIRPEEFNAVAKPEKHISGPIQPELDSTPKQPPELYGQVPPLSLRREYSGHGKYRSGPIPGPQELWSTVGTELETRSNVAELPAYHYSDYANPYGNVRAGPAPNSYELQGPARHHGPTPIADRKPISPSTIDIKSPLASSSNGGRSVSVVYSPTSIDNTTPLLDSVTGDIVRDGKGGAIPTNISQEEMAWLREERRKIRERELLEREEELTERMLQLRMSHGRLDGHPF